MQHGRGDGKAAVGAEGVKESKKIGKRKGEGKRAVERVKNRKRSKRTENECKARKRKRVSEESP